MTKCEFCNGKGWAVTYGYGSNDESKNGRHIEKCDECNIFKSDYAATIYKAALVASAKVATRDKAMDAIKEETA